MTLRRVQRLLVFLLLGVIVNVAVAWGCAYFNDLDADLLNFEQTTSPRWPLVCVDRRFGSEEVHLGYRLSNGTDVDSLRAHPENPWWVKWHDRFGAVGTLPWGAAHGWPMYSLSAWRDWNPDPNRIALDEDGMTFGGWELAGRNRSYNLRLIPLTPIWPGFAINTIFYAGILWMMYATPFALRRMRGGRRIKRGLCPACAYPVGESHICTECGTPVMTQRIA